jgi:hypothetical protein
MFHADEPGAKGAFDAAEVLRRANNWANLAASPNLLQPQPTQPHSKSPPIFKGWINLMCKSPTCLKGVLLLLLTILLFGQCNAASITAVRSTCFVDNEDCEGAPTDILIAGLINQGDAEKFSKAVYEMESR